MPEHLHKLVIAHAKEIDKTPSSACRLLIELGLDVELAKKKNKETDQRKDELFEKQISYLLQNLNISKEILRCVFQESSVISGGKNAEDNLKIIKEGSEKYIEGYLKK